MYTLLRLNFIALIQAKNRLFKLFDVVNITMKKPLRLRELQNLGPASEKILQGAGISTVEQLLELGAVACYQKVIEHETKHKNLNLLYALEGAIRDVHWQTIARDDKMRLLLILDDLNLEDTHLQ